MTTLNLTGSEPAIRKSSAKVNDTISGNAAFYERLQGQTKKTAIDRYGWVALPVGAAAILAIVAATSTPNRSADNIAAGPVDAKPAVASNNTAMTPAVTPASPDDIHAKIADASPAAAPATSQAAPAPVRVARRAPEPAARAASATQPQTVPAQSVTAPPAPVIAAPAPVEAPAPAVSAPANDAAPAPAEAAPAPADPAPAQ